MSHKDDVLPCPLCAGQGQLQRSEIIERFSDPNFKEKVDGYLAEIRKPTEDCEEALVGTGAKPRDFFKEVHSWNPQLPIWRRSPKE